MGEYENYVASLKQVSIKRDDQNLRSRLDSRLNQRAPRIALAMGGALAVIFISFAVYLGIYFSLPGNGGSLSEYLLQRGDLNSDQIINYIFTE